MSHGKKQTTNVAEAQFSEDVNKINIANNPNAKYDSKTVVLTSQN